MGRDRPGRATAVIGFCLAAGAGTRLEPLTRATPKPLLAPAGRPLIDLAVEALQRAGATRVVVNAHHGADQLVGHLAGRAGVEVVVEPVLLGTGGGLINAAHLGLLGTGDDPVLVTAADHVLDPADLTDLAEFLERSGTAMATGLTPATTNPFRLRLEAATGSLSPGVPGGEPSPPGGRIVPDPAGTPDGPGGREERDPDHGTRHSVGGQVARDPAGPWDSAGAYALRAGLVCDLGPGPATLSERVLGPLLNWGRLAGLPFRRPVADAGTPARLLDVSTGLLTGRWPYDLPAGQLRQAAGTGPVFVAEGAEIDPTAVLAGPVVVDTGARVGAGAVVTRSVVGPRAVVGPGARVTGSFLGPGAQLPPVATATAALVPGSPADPANPAQPAPSPLGPDASPPSLGPSLPAPDPDAPRPDPPLHALHPDPPVPGSDPPRGAPHHDPPPPAPPDPPGMRHPDPSAPGPRWGSVAQPETEGVELSTTLRRSPTPGREPGVVHSPPARST